MSELLNEAATPKKEQLEFELDILDNVTLPSMMDVFTPQSFEIDDSPSPQFETPSSGPCESPKASSPEPTQEKKPVKKRKSWGQELPTPTTNLPPRKRAKTEAEKEQRRIERVLRNRAAAQSSRERKRKEVEALEDQKNNLAVENKLLNERNAKLETLNLELSKRVEMIFRQNEVLQAQMKYMQEEFSKSKDKPSDFNPLLLTPPVEIQHDVTPPSAPSTPSTFDGTLDPSHLSTPSTSQEEPFGLTQHTAVMLCDLPCQPKTGQSLQVEAMLAIMQWTLLLTSAISSQVPLIEVIFYLVTKRPIPNSELARLFPLIHLLTTIKPTQRLRQRLLTISPVCALLLDATAWAPWFECPTDVLKWASSEFSNVSMEENEEDPVWACRKFVMANLEGGIDYGPIKGHNMGRWTEYRNIGFDFSQLSKGMVKTV